MLENITYTEGLNEDLNVQKTIAVSYVTFGVEKRKPEENSNSRPLQYRCKGHGHETRASLFLSGFPYTTAQLVYITSMVVYTFKKYIEVTSESSAGNSLHSKRLSGGFKRSNDLRLLPARKLGQEQKMGGGVGRERRTPLLHLPPILYGSCGYNLIAASYFPS